jgi:hypothetical protein
VDPIVFSFVGAGLIALMGFVVWFFVYLEDRKRNSK